MACLHIIGPSYFLCRLHIIGSYFLCRLHIIGPSYFRCKLHIIGPSLCRLHIIGPSYFLCKLHIIGPSFLCRLHIIGPSYFLCKLHIIDPSYFLCRLLKEKRMVDESFNRFLEMKRGAAMHTLESLMLLPVSPLALLHCYRAVATCVFGEESTSV